MTGPDDRERGDRQRDPGLEAFIERPGDACVDDALDEPPRGVHPARIVSVAAVILIVAAVIGPTWDELLYHFDDAEALEILDATAMDAALPPVGATVRARVVLGNRAARIEGWRRGTLRFGPIEVRQVLGAPLFVEHDQTVHPSWGPFSEVDIEGRVVEMAGPDLEGVRDLIEREQGLRIPPETRVIVIDERPGQMGRYVVAWALGVLLILLSIRSLVRAARR